MDTKIGGENVFQTMVLALFQNQHAHAVNMEPGTTNPGIPDINWCMGGIEGNLELKYGISGGLAPHVRPTQVVWFRERIRAGGYPMLAYFIEDREYTDEVYIYQGRYIEHLATAKNIDDLDDIESLRIINPMEMIEGLISEIASWHDQLNPQIMTIN